jgi:hypothetical protein
VKYSRKNEYNENNTVTEIVSTPATMTNPGILFTQADEKV